MKQIKLPKQYWCK